MNALKLRCGASAGSTAYSYDDADRITAITPPSPAPAVSYAWDNNGNLTNRGSDTFAWDYEDRMTSATVNSATTTFAYRGDGRAAPQPYNGRRDHNLHLGYRGRPARRAR